MIKTPSEYKQMEWRWFLKGLAQAFKPEVYVEIGVKKCYTFNEMAPLVGKAIAVDIEPAPVVALPNVEFYQMSSDQFAEFWDGTPIDFLFIDGDHSCKQVRKDVAQLLPYVREETGLIFLHDTYPIREELLSPGYCSDAWKAAAGLYDAIYEDKITGAYELEVLTFPGPWAGLTVIRKRAWRHGWMDKGI